MIRMHCGLADRGGFELDHHGGAAGGFASSWAAVLGHAVGAGGMMSHPGEGHHAGAFPAHAHHPHHQHGAMPMDLHVPQAFQYYRSVRRQPLHHCRKWPMKTNHQSPIQVS